MRTFVKFCGLRDADAIAEVPDGGAAGFVVECPASPRNLTIADAARLIESVPAGIEAWAVVVQPPAELIHRLFDEMGVDRVQVYGPIPEGLEYLEIHHLVPSVPVRTPGTEAPDPKVPPAEDYSRLHLDCGGTALPGGSGVRPDWEVCERIVDQNPGRKVILAGGLTAENVAEAMARVHPWGVDVSSGIEASPGIKDVGRMRAFRKAVEEFEASHA